MIKLEKRLLFLSKICACVTVLVGLLALIGWLEKIPFLVQLTPLAFIQANTALCFILSGAALFLASNSNFRAVRVLSFFILVFAGTTLFEYIFKLNLGIDELFFKDFIVEGASHPNRMAPNTAFCFTLLAVVFFVSDFCLKNKRGHLLVAILGGLVFVMASIALSGFLVGLEEAFGWGRMTRMSPQTAITFMVISAGIISLAWECAVRLAKGIPVWASSFASLAVLTIFIGIWQSLVIGELQFIRADLQLKHETMLSKILFELKDKTFALQRMGKRFEIDFAEAEYQQEWEMDAINYLNHYGDFKSIVWVDSDYRVQWKVAENDAAEPGDLSLINSPRDVQIMNTARERGTWYSPAYSTSEGKKVVSVFTPLFHQGKFLGFIRGEIFIDKLLGKVFAKGKNEIQASIFENETLFFQRRIKETGDPEHWLISSVLEYNGLRWEFKCLPGKSFLMEMRSPKPEIVMGFGLLLSWALGAAVRSGQRAREHETELISTHEKLERQFEKRREQQVALEISEKKYKTLFSQVKSIIEDVSGESGKELYALLAEKMAATLGVRYGFIGELDPLDDRKINTLAVCKGSHLLENFIYNISGTPCENVLAQGLYTYSRNVRKMFPDSKMLSYLGVEAYVGIPLTDSSNNPIGILVAMHDEAMESLENIKLILPLFADIAESEMERQVFENELQWESERVQISRDIAVAANDFPEMEGTLTFALERLCRFMDWPVGHLYLKKENSSEFIPSGLWHFDSPERYKTLKEITENTTFTVGKGLPGRVAETGRPEWISDVYTNEDFPRAKKTDELGIGTAVACPILIRKDVVGVMEFFTPKILDINWEILDLMGQVGTQIGRVLERKKAEDELKKQAEVLDKIHDAVISLDMSLNITGWNRGAEHIFHYMESEVMNKSISAVFKIPEEILKQTVVIPAQIKGSHEMEITAIRKGGEEIFVHLSLSALNDEKCIPQSLVCYALDINEKKQAQLERERYSQTLKEQVDQRTEELNNSLSEIRAAKSQTEGILKSIGEGLIVTDLSGTIVLMNHAAGEILSLEVKEALGKEADQVIQNQLLLSQIFCNDEKENSEEPFEFELWGDSGSSKRKFVQGVSTIIRNEKDELVGNVTVLRDITFERKVDNLKSQFLSTAAHELRTPLTSLQGFSEILLHKKDLPPESVNKYLRYINEESLKLGNIINDFLDISRIESGREISLDKKTYAVSDTIDRSMQLFGEANKASHEFVFECPPRTVKWKVDLGKMEQVFKNLYSNATKYSPKGGKITTSVHRNNGHTEVVVEDNGTGMTKEQVANVFNKFYRGDNMDNSIPGSGL
ncbi:MAG: PAS domain S-box protein, partial [Nitrospina sp.]|nr:PAS domain S-box protein [Nitrospina sp.]